MEREDVFCGSVLEFELYLKQLMMNGRSFTVILR